VPVLRIDYVTPENVLPGMRQVAQTGLKPAKFLAKDLLTIWISVMGTLAPVIWPCPIEL
jgi:hypothetical protein